VSLLSPGSEFESMCPSCIVSDDYIRAGGTSMSAPMVAGVVANMLEVHPHLTPDEVKAILLDTARSVGAGEAPVTDRAVRQDGAHSNPNEGIEPNTLVNPQTGAIDYTRSRWSRSRWSRSRWSNVYSCDCLGVEADSVDPTRSRWSRSRWSRSRWSTSWTK
jgi:serine protease AprX